MLILFAVKRKLTGVSSENMQVTTEAMEIETVLQLGKCQIPLGLSSNTVLS